MPTTMLMLMRIIAVGRTKERVTVGLFIYFCHYLFFFLPLLLIWFMVLKHSEENERKKEEKEKKKKKTSRSPRKISSIFFFSLSLESETVQIRVPFFFVP